MRSTILGAMLTIILSGGTALAQSAPASPAPPPAPQPAAQTGPDASVSELPRADLGVTSGWNNPGGLYGILAEYRAIDRLGIGLGAGKGAWGTRLTPQLRFYPFGASSSGFFLSSGVAMNFGGDATEEVNGHQDEVIHELLTPVLDVDLGYRAPLGRHAFIGIEAGYGLSLRKNNTVTDGSGTGLLDLAVAASQPGGPIVGLSLGGSFL